MNMPSSRTSALWDQYVHYANRSRSSQIPEMLQHPRQRRARLKVDRSFERFSQGGGGLMDTRLFLAAGLAAAEHALHLCTEGHLVHLISKRENWEDTLMSGNVNSPLATHGAINICSRHRGGGWFTSIISTTRFPVELAKKWWSYMEERSCQEYSSKNKQVPRWHIYTPCLT